MNLTIDVETRSRIDLKACGVYVYANDPSTDVLCLAVKEDQKPTKIWMNTDFLTEELSLTMARETSDNWSHDTASLLSTQDLAELILKAKSVVAHNANFERVIWQHIMHKRYGLPPIADNVWRCTYAKAAIYALPRTLEGVCSALHLPVQKDMEGYKVMMQMCKPRKPSKKDKNPWWESVEKFTKLCNYCIKDVDAEHEIDKRLRNLKPMEERIWLLDQKINDFGVAIDVDGIKNLINKVQKKEDELLMEIQILTKGYITSVRQRDKTLSWLHSQGFSLPDLQKDTIEQALQADEIPSNVRRLLEIRQSLGKSSVAKLMSLYNMGQDSGRVRGSLMYHGASTGRWSGRGIQPQNFPRETLSTEDIDDLMRLSTTEIDMLYDCTIQTASKALRGMLVAAPGKALLCADFNAIEGRVLAWVAGEEDILQNYRDNKDPYLVFAAQIYGTSYEKLKELYDKGDQDAATMRFNGKTGELACGYQGWVRAVHQFAPTMPEEQAEIIVRTWREFRRKTVAFWAGVEHAAIRAVKKPQSTFTFGPVKFGMRDEFLHCQLPSGRLLAYCQPESRTVTTRYGQEKEVIIFRGLDSITDKWTQLSTYGGKLTENIVQAVSRDLLAEALLRLDAAGFDICLHVHDEILVEDREPEKLKMMCELMELAPSWAEGLPLVAKGWAGRRYQK